MTADEMCLLATQRGYVIVDAENGRVFASRFRMKLMGHKNKLGYTVSTLHADGFRKQVKLHRLIWIAVNGIPPNGTMMDHINRQKSDNRISNLRLADSVLNTSNRRSYVGAGNPAAKINKRIAEKIRSLKSEGHTAREIAPMFGVSKSLVAQIARNELWKNTIHITAT